MSISGAVAELNEEIERLIGIRDSLLAAQPGVAAATRLAPAPAKKSAAKKTTAAKKSATVSEAAPAKKRTMSPEARKKISEANRKRWAAQKKNAAK
jgi:hypothetical protein